ncbi:MAG: hypothetical protein LBT14_02605 [Treponema sp.]|jgi:hypothetical protein|nr:hypothetical protein [Treponema sp.]
MKKHTRNLLIASVTYVAAFVVVTVLSMIAGIIYLDLNDPDVDVGIYIGSIFFTALVSWLVYMTFYFIQRQTAKDVLKAKYLGLGPRILGGLMASACAVAVLLILCFFWISDYGDVESILRTYIDVAGGILLLFIAINFVDFIVLKPRP